MAEPVLTRSTTRHRPQASSTCRPWARASTPRMPAFEYPEYDFAVTDALTNFEMPEAVEPVPREPAMAGTRARE